MAEISKTEITIEQHEVVTISARFGNVHLCEKCTAEIHEEIREVLAADRQLRNRKDRELIPGGFDQI